MELFTPDLQRWLDLAGIFVFALSGALLAVRKDFDVIGIAMLAFATGLGGGIFRDLVIGAVPPAAFRDLGYFVTPLITSVLVIFLHPQVARINRGVQVFDAAGLGFFCVVGTVKAHEYGLGAFAAAALGVATAAGGGVVRDVLANEVPLLLRRDREIYAVPAIVGAGSVALLLHHDALSDPAMALCVLLAFALRLLALHYGWRAPRAWHRSGARTEEG